MDSRTESVWKVIEARDATLARLHDIVRGQHAELTAKESVIQSIHRELRVSRDHHHELADALEKRDHLIRELRKALEVEAHHHETADPNEREAAVPRLHKAIKQLEFRRQELMKGLEEKEAVIQSLHKAVRNFEEQQRMLAKSLEEKELAMRGLNLAVGSPEVQLVMVRALEEKEAVIRELRRAVDAYRSAFSIFGFVIRPLNLLLAPVRFAVREALGLLVPRLGNLNQHPPRKLALRFSSPPVGLAPPPRISIVTPSFRQAAFIERTIQSVLDQGYPNLEYVVQDGGSDDGTAEILARYHDRLAACESKPDSGQAEAINRGFARTTGEIMAWLNSDDILFPGALAFVADFFQRHPDVDVVYGHRLLIDENDQEIGRWMMPEHSDKVLSWADYIPQETLFWRRRIWDKAGGKVDESFRFALDWDLLIRFRDCGARFARLSRFLGGFRIHPQQKTSAAISEVGFREMDRIRERVLGRVPTTIEVRKAVAPYLLKHVATDLGWRIRNTLGLSP